MNAVDKWAERVYAETDFGRSVATSIAGVVGLVVYLLVSDWVIAAFSAIIAFPISRLVAAGIHARATRRANSRLAWEEAERLYKQLSEEEKDVVQGFVDEGGCVLTWGQMNALSTRSASVESLIQRGVLWTSMTADGMRETFVLDAAIFDVGQARRHERPIPF